MVFLRVDFIYFILVDLQKKVILLSYLRLQYIIMLHTKGTCSKKILKNWFFYVGYSKFDVII